MIQLYQKITQLKVLSWFLEHPTDKYYLRECARILKMSPMTVKRSLDFLVKQEYLIRRIEKNQIFYSANVDNIAVRYLKIQRNLAWLEDRKMVEMILKEMKGVSSIVLFGSYARGENDSDSDIDLLVISNSKEKPTAKAARLLERDVNFLNFSHQKWTKEVKTNPALYLDIITDGIVLYGTKPVVT